MPAPFSVYRHATLTFVLLATIISNLFPAGGVTAQEATPVFDPVIPVITETPVTEPTAEPTPTSEPVADPTPADSDASTPAPTTDNAEAPHNTDTFVLINPADLFGGPATLDEGGSLHLAYDYMVTTDRASTTFTAEILNEYGVPAEGWTVSLNATDENPWTEIAHVTAGDAFRIEVTITGPADAPHTVVQLGMTSVVQEKPEEDDTDASADANGNTHPGSTTVLVIQNREPQVLIAPASVQNDAPLSCAPANDGDVISPGEIIYFSCEYVLSGLGVVPTFSATVTLDPESFANGWEMSVIWSTPAGLIGGQTGWTAQSQTITPPILATASAVQFTVLVKAPLSTTIPSATITVNTSCKATLGLGNSACAGILGSPVTKQAILEATLQITGSSSGGGALLNNLLLPGLQPGQVLFELHCQDVSLDRMIPQGNPVRAMCTINSTVGLDVLNLLSVTGQIRVTASPGPFSYSVQSQYLCSDDLSALCLGDIATASLISGVDFDIVVNPVCGPITPGNIEAIRLDADYGLDLLSSGLTVSLTDGWANIPFTISEGDLSGPMTSVNTNPVAFGESMWNGSSYPFMASELNLTISPPASGCLAPGSTVSISGGQALTNDEQTFPIANEHLGITSVSTTDVPWGSSNDISGPLNGTYPIFEADGDTATDSSDADVTVNLQLEPPDNAPPGSYNGTILITTSPEGPGE